MGGANPMPVLSLDQPWASLVAMGVKSVETRSWSTSYRGPLAIAATKNRPKMMHLPPLTRSGTWDEQDAHNHQTWSVLDTITDPAFQGMQQCHPVTGRQRRIPRRATTPTLFYPHAGPWGRKHVEGTPATKQGTAVYLPLGAIVATCVLVDCVRTERVQWMPERFDVKGRMVEWARWGMSDSIDARIAEEQRPFGDFGVGRFAWLLADVKPLDEPVPFRGGHGLSRKWAP